jgi:hypothetical protein
VIQHAIDVLLLASPAIFLMPMYADRRADTLTVCSQGAMLLGFLAYLAVLVPLARTVGRRLRVVWLGVAACAPVPPIVADSLRSHGFGSVRVTPDDAIGFAFAIGFASFACYTYVRARRMPAIEPLALAFPFASGEFLVVQGGSDGLLNHHHKAEAQRYALDMVKIEDTPFVAAFRRHDAQDYPSFGLSVHSPAPATIIRVVDDCEDNLSLRDRDRARAAGNHIVLALGDARLVIAHLKRGSISRVVGEVVQQGDYLALSGNSGNSTEPHLHLHAEAGGSGIPIIFNGRYLIRNSIVVA